MNYQEFMNRLEQQLQDMSKDELMNWMKLKAASADVTERESFLQSLYQKQPTTSLPNIDWEELNSWCESIDTGEYYLLKTFNEEYDDWYDDAEDEYEIEDSFHIIDKIYDIFHKAKKLAYAKEYAQAFTLYDLLFQRTYHIQSDYGDIDTMGLLVFLMESGHSCESNSAIFSEYCFLNYIANKSNAIETIYNARKQERRIGKLEESFSTDFGILEETTSIMHAWVKFLSTKEDEDIELLFEALIYDGKLDTMVNFCETHAEAFPTLFYLCAKHLADSNEYEKCEAFCYNGIQVLDSKKRIRSKTMEIGRTVSEVLHHEANKKKFTLEAFRSDSTIEQYLMLMKDEVEPSMLEEAYQIAGKLSIDTSLSCFGSKENMIKHIDLTAICFLHGDFEASMNELNSNTTTLGWSYHPVKFLVCAFLILLAQDQMPTNIKKRLLNYGGINNNEDIVISWFQKQNIKDELKQEYLNILIKQIDERTDAILEGKFRKSYGKAALLNIGLQYVFDNLHMGISAKDRCKSRYQRRPAFYQEWDGICGK